MVKEVLVFIVVVVVVVVFFHCSLGLLPSSQHMWVFFMGFFLLA